MGKSIKSWKESAERTIPSRIRELYRRRVFHFDNGIIMQVKISGPKDDKFYIVESMNNPKEGFHYPCGAEYTLKDAFKQFRSELENPVPYGDE